MKFLVFFFSFFLTLAHGQEFLDPQIAFQPKARMVDGKTVEIQYAIAEGYYLYRDKFRVRPTDKAVATLGTLDISKGKKKTDEFFGDVEVFYQQATLRVPLSELHTSEALLKIDLVAQGCADAGLCYPPQTQTVSLDLGPTEPTKTTTAPVLIPTSLSISTPASTTSTASEVDETGLIANTLKQSGLWATLGFFFLAGLGLSLTPCVFPMVPILSGIIAGQGAQASKKRSITLSVAYVLGMSLTYASAGVAAGLTGTLLSAALQNAWVLGSFATVFVVLSLSMFGFYELQLPASLQGRLAQSSGQLQGGRTFAVFVMGALSALIVGPCVAAPLAGALLYIGQTGDAMLGGVALFTMALGMGVPLLVVGIAGGALMPKAGMWMEGIKKTFGVLLLATALWLVSPVIPPVVEMLGWALLLIIPAMYLHALDPLPVQAPGWMRFWKGIGLTMLLCGAALVLGALAGNRDALQPLAGIAPSTSPAATTAEALPFERIRSVADLKTRLSSVDRPVLVDVYADWCTACKEMEKHTFTNSSVRAQMQNFVRLKIDVTAHSEEDRLLLSHFGLFGPPGILFFNPQGKEHTGQRVVGFQKAEKFLRVLERVSL